MAKRIVILGGGPGGIEAACTAARLGGQVTLICDRLWGNKMGQSVLWSKMWMHGANEGALTADVRDELNGASVSWRGHLEDELKGLGVEILIGKGRFQSARTIEVTDENGHLVTEREVDAAIIATGSSPVFPPGLEPDGDRVFAPHMIDGLAAPPKDMFVIGDGGPGLVYVDALSRLGVQVTWFGGAKRVLSKLSLSVSEFFRREFEARGMVLCLGQFMKRLERHTDGVAAVMPDDTTYEASCALVAIGYRPNLSDLNLDAAGLEVNERGRVVVDAFGRTAVSHVYVAGDATGFGTANTSMAQGRIAASDAMGIDVPPFQMEHIVIGYETQPHVASVGNLDVENVQVVQVPYASEWKIHEKADKEGFVELGYDAQRRVVWGVAVGPNAGDILAPVGLAIRVGATVDDLAGVYGMHPSMSEVVFEAARRAR